MTHPASIPKHVFWDLVRRNLIAVRDYEEVTSLGRKSAITRTINDFLEDFEHKGYHE